MLKHRRQAPSKCSIHPVNNYLNTEMVHVSSHGYPHTKFTFPKNIYRM